MFKMFAASLLVLGLLGSSTASAHQEDLITAKGRVGPIQTNETTTADMRSLFGEPNSRKIVQIGCSRVVRLRWDDIQTYHYRDQRVVVDVKVRSRTVDSLDTSYDIHTFKDLRVGDSEHKLKKLYDPEAAEPHRGHTHYILSGDKPELLAKVVNGVVVELEAAPYEYC